MALPDWITLSKNSGSNSDTVDITASENSGEERSATLIIASDLLSTQINITQESNNNRTVYLEVFLVSFGRTENGKYENVYGLRAFTDYIINSGNISVNISVTDPTTETITRRAVTINGGSKSSEIAYVAIQASSVIDTSTRFTVNNVRTYVKYNVVNNTSYALTIQPAVLYTTNILTITGVNFSNDSTISYELRNINNTVIDIGNLVNTKHLMVSWPYRGGYNICSYKVTRTYYITDTIYHTEYLFELPTVSMDIGGGIMKEYYDVWNCIMDERYKPVKKFKLTTESYKSNLAHKETTISDIEFVTGQIYGYTYLNSDGTIESINSPYKAGLADDSGYGGIKYSIRNDYYEGLKGLCWYHRPLQDNEEMITTVIKFLNEGSDFSSTDFLETTTNNILLYSTEYKAEIEATKTILSSNDNMDMFYHPYKHPNSIFVS